MANEKITLQELAVGLAARNKCSVSKAELFLRKIFVVVKRGLEQDNLVKIKGLGTFKQVTVSPRQSVNVQNGERIEIQEHQRILFTPDATMKLRVNKPYEHFETLILETDEEKEIAQQVFEAEEPAEDAQMDDVQKNGSEEDSVVDQEEVVAEEESVVEKEKLSVNSMFLGEIPTEEETTNSVKTSEETVPEEIPTASDTTSNEQEESSEDIETNEDDEEYEEEPSHRWKTFLCWLGVVCLIVGAYLLGYYRVLNFPPIAQQETKEVKQITPTTNQASMKVTQPVEQLDSVELARQKAEQEAKAALEESKKYEQLPNGEYLIVGTLEEHAMKPTDTLLKLSRKVYGSKDFVNYIVFYNQLKNPDVIPLGTVLKFPRLIKKE